MRSRADRASTQKKINQRKGKRDIVYLNEDEMSKILYESMIAANNKYQWKRKLLIKKEIK